MGTQLLRRGSSSLSEQSLCREKHGRDASAAICEQRRGDAGVRRGGSLLEACEPSSQGKHDISRGVSGDVNVNRGVHGRGVEPGSGCEGKVGGET